MHPVQIVFILICLVLLAFGMLWSAEFVARRVHGRVKRLQVSAHETAAAVAPSDPPSGVRDEGPSLAQDGAALAPRDEGSGDVLHLTSVEIVRGLALVKRVDSDGAAEWLSKDRIAAVAGMRATDARALIDELRGTPPKPEPGPRFEQVGPSSYRRVEGT